MSVAAIDESTPATPPPAARPQPEPSAASPIVEGAPETILEEMKCGECENVMAEVYCEECHEQYCRSCSVVVHSKGRRKQHSDFMKLFACGECSVVFSSVECSQCKETFCDNCFKKAHSRGLRKEKGNLHKPVSLANKNLQLANHEQNNAFGILRSELSFQRFLPDTSAAIDGAPVRELPDQTAAMKEKEECDFRISMLDTEAQEQFRDTLCSLSPDQPIPENLISTGTDDESQVRLNEQKLRRQDSFDARVEMFGDEIEKFYCWRRINEISDSEGALFCHRHLPTTHELPQCLSVVPEKDGSFSIDGKPPAPAPASTSAPLGDSMAVSVNPAESTNPSSGANGVMPPSPPPSSSRRRGKRDPNATILNACNSTAALAVSHYRFMGFVPSFERCALADNFVLLAVAAVMKNRQMFTDMFASCEHLKQGMATFRFFETPKRFIDPAVSPRRRDGTIPGKEKDLPAPTPLTKFVTIDSLLPCNEELQVAIGRTDQSLEFGFALFEKAYATFIGGSLARLHHGRIDRTLEHLTRGEGTFLRWTRDEGSRLSPEGLNQLKWYLQEATLLNLPMVATDTQRCNSMEGKVAADGNSSSSSSPVPPLIRPLRNELFAQHGDTSAADFDWNTGKVVHFCVDYHQPQDTLAPAGALATGANTPATNYNRTPRSVASRAMTRAGPGGYRAADLKTWSVVKTQSLYDEFGDFGGGAAAGVTFAGGLDDTFESMGGEADAEPRPFSEQSSLWTKHARKALNHFSVDTKLKWETVEDFATTHDCVLMMRNPYLQTDATMHFSAIPHSIAPRNMALHLPHFLLAVDKIDDCLDEAGAIGETINTEFRSVDDDLVPPEINLGDVESDDEVDPLARSTSSRTSSGNDRLLPNSSQALTVQFRVSFPASIVRTDSYIPLDGRLGEEASDLDDTNSQEANARAAQWKPSYRTDNMSLMAYRVPGPVKQKCIQAEVEGRPVASLPAHSRVGVQVLSTTENEMLCQMEANTGFYNIVLVPSESCFPAQASKAEYEVPEAKPGEELNNFVYSLTAIKRNNGDSYNVGFCPL